MLGAFFIVTDPVSGCTTFRGKLIFGFAAGVMAYIIRVFGGYPDGVAFAVLLMNLCVPLIDMYTQPPIFGMKNSNDATGQDAHGGRMAVRTAVILLIFVVAFTSLLAAAFLWTRPAIEAAAAEEKMKLIAKCCRASSTIMTC
jgi:hypothetical protein